MRVRLSILSLFFSLTLLSTAAHAAPIVFNLEDVPAGPQDSLASLQLTSGGVTLTITRENGGTFNVFDPIGFPPSFGDRVLPLFASADNAAFLINFSEPIYLFGLDFGNIGAENDEVTISAYSDLDQAGLIDSEAFDYPGLSFPAFETVAIGGPIPAQSVRVLVGNAPMTIYFDNFVVDTAAPVPEPALLLLVASGMAGVGLRRRRRE